MKRFVILISVVCLAGAALAVAAMSFAAASKPNGSGIFREKCSMCHGTDGKGFAAIHTPDFTDPKWQAGKTDKQLLDAIKSGVKGTAMMPFDGKLSEAEMQAVLDHIRSLDKQKKEHKKK